MMAKAEESKDDAMTRGKWSVKMDVGPREMAREEQGGAQFGALAGWLTSGLGDWRGGDDDVRERQQEEAEGDVSNS